MWYQETHPPGTRPRELPRTRGSSTAQDTLTLILTGRTQSFLEACGCKSNMSGGITRRATLLDQIRQRRDNALVIDSGDLFPDIRDVPEMDDLTSTEIDTYLESLVRMGYGFAAIAGNEVSYGPEFLKSKVRDSPIPMISANVLHRGIPIAPPRIVLDVGRHRFGFIGLLQERVGIQQSAFSDNTWDVEIADPMSALRRHLGELIEEVDFVGVVGGLHTELVFEIVEEFPELDLLVTTGHDYPLVDILRDGRISNSKDQMYGFLGRTLVLYANADVYGIHSFDVGVGATFKRCGNREKATLTFH